MLQKKIPWGMVFLLGGGFAISTGGNKSGLAASVGKSLLSLQVFSPFVIMCLICIFVSFVTEFTSNVGIANLIIPVISEMVRIFLFHMLIYILYNKRQKLQRKRFRML